MTNTTFNYQLRRIFQENVTNEEFISELMNLWLTNFTTNQQNEVLEKVKNLAMIDDLPCINRYLLPEKAPKHIIFE